MSAVLLGSYPPSALDERAGTTRRRRTPTPGAADTISSSDASAAVPRPDRGDYDLGVGRSGWFNALERARSFSQAAGSGTQSKKFRARARFVDQADAQLRRESRDQVGKQNLMHTATRNGLAPFSAAVGLAALQLTVRALPGTDVSFAPAFHLMMIAIVWTLIVSTAEAALRRWADRRYRFWSNWWLLYTPAYLCYVAAALAFYIIAATGVF